MRDSEEERDFLNSFDDDEHLPWHNFSGSGTWENMQSEIYSRLYNEGWMRGVYKNEIIYCEVHALL